MSAFVYSFFTLFSSTSAALVATSNVPAGWSYTGCYTDGTNGRALAKDANTNSQMTAQTCISYCSGLGYGVAGTEYYTQCCECFPSI
jgi:hypothetical protein